MSFGLQIVIMDSTYKFNFIGIIFLAFRKIKGVKEMRVQKDPQMLKYMMSISALLYWVIDLY